MEQGVVSDLASYRYRAAIPARELQAAGHDCRWIALPEKGAALRKAMEQARRVDVVIFAKNHANLDGVIALLDAAKASGAATIVDICDDFFEAGSPFLIHYRRLVDRAHAVVASCDHLASVIAEATRIAPMVVSDFYEGPRGRPQWDPATQGVKALWFGSQGNMHSLMREIDALARKIQGYRLDLLVLSKGLPGIENAFKKFNAQFRSKMTLRFLEWSLARNWDELNKCDMVLIPVNRTTRFFMAKGPNRVVESLWGGNLWLRIPFRPMTNFPSGRGSAANL